MEVEPPTSVGVYPLGPLIECCYKIHGRGRMLIRFINRLIDQATEWLSHDNLIMDICLDKIIDHWNTCHDWLVDIPTLIITVLGGNNALLDASLCLWIIIG